MFKFIPLLLMAALQTLCSRMKPLRAYGAQRPALGSTGGETGVRFPANPTLSLPSRRKQSPSKARATRITGVDTVPYPWFSVTLVSSTKKILPDLPAARKITRQRARRTNSYRNMIMLMILSNTENLNMVFNRWPTEGLHVSALAHSGKGLPPRSRRQMPF